MQRIRFVLNGVAVSVDVEEREMLLPALRQRLGLRSVKEGCSIGECGVCTVLIDDLPCYSCLTLASKIDGRDVKTVEFLGAAGLLHPLQEAFVQSGAVQCGYCTPAMLLSAYSLLLRNEDPDDGAVKEALSGNLCRCTGYVQIVEAVRRAAGMLKSSEVGVRRPGSGEKAVGLLSGGDVSLNSSTIPHLRNDPSVGQRPRRGDILALLADNPGVRIIAGGTDVFVKARKRTLAESFVDVSRTAGMTHIGEEPGMIRVGAATTHARIAADPLIRKGAPSLAIASGQVGSPQVRNMGTIGGNLVNGSPAADTVAPLLIHEGMISLESARGVRLASVREFITGPYETAIGADELLTSVCLEDLSGYREGYRRVTKRAALAVSRLSVAWAIREHGGRFEDVRLAIGACTPVPFRAVETELFLKGREKTPRGIVEAVRLTIEGIIHASGVRPSYAYKLPVLRDLIMEALSG